MSVIEIGKKLVDLCNAGKGLEAVETLYDEKIVSIEGQGSDELPQRMEGIEAIKGKNTWWSENHQVHSAMAAGPYCGQKMRLVEVGLYTVADGKIVQEEFLYLRP